MLYQATGTFPRTRLAFRPMLCNHCEDPASGISQESYWAIALGIVIVVDLVISWRSGSVCCGKLAGKTAAVAVLVLTFASVAVARYAFFAMGVGA